MYVCIYVCKKLTYGRPRSTRRPESKGDKIQSAVKEKSRVGWNTDSEDDAAVVELEINIPHIKIQIRSHENVENSLHFVCLTRYKVTKV